MKYCKHCGKEIEDTASYCPFCGNEIENALQSKPISSVKHLSIPAIMLASCSALSIVLLFLDWIKINVFGIVSTAFSPATVIFRLSDVQEFWGSYMSGDEAYIIPCIIVAAVIFLILYAITIFFAVKKNAVAMVTGLLAHLVMLGFGIASIHYGNIASDNSYGMISLTPVVYITIIAACCGIVSSVWLFYDKSHSLSATISAIFMLVLVALIPILFVFRGLGTGIVYIAFAQYIILYLFFHSSTSNA